ncbi:MAG: type II toxin-antitoxin system Phd/YefM family antitoxin [Cellulomonadaceae bacterium]|jgi:hypothetical protein|nr:type II toxin-antitoxin system Phd/YefM family antitoxin [Cellulomonadaceae bacterium]
MAIDFQYPLIGRHIKFSDLSRASKSVAEATENGPVFIERRNGQNLVLLREEDMEADRRGLEIAAEVIGVLSTDRSELIPEHLERAFPWSKFLNDDELKEFSEEVITATRACASVAKFAMLASTVAAWKSTAEAIAAGWDRSEPNLLPHPVQLERPSVV